MIKIIFVDKKKGKYSNEIDNYIARIKRHTPIAVSYVKSFGGENTADILKKEEFLIHKMIGPDDFVVLLDDKGEEFTSDGFSKWLLKIITSKNIVFVVGSAYGLSNNLKKQYYPLSLSKMTFSHFTARLLLTESLYRAFCILNNSSYIK